jgi:hypothetical protein
MEKVKKKKHKKTKEFLLLLQVEWLGFVVMCRLSDAKE